MIIGGGAAGMAAAIAAAENGHEVHIYEKNEKLGKKIREAQLGKVPYMLVVGDRDVENQTVSVRHRADGDLGAMSTGEFAALLRDIVDSKAKK